jgi:TorA maturation chaperone TorD/Pyruvate/2-oxoacid:ferredoxin oxidoreductase delta subunit
MDTKAASQRSRTYADLAQAFSKAESGLEQEFTRLFVGPGRPVAHPYESVYREGRTMGETTLDVRCRLAKEGLAPSGRWLPDHVAIELAFMAHLAAREALAWDADDSDEAWCQLRQQGSFLHEHLCAWLPQFCHRILAGRPSVHYATLAQRAESFVVNDAAKVRAWLGDGLVAAEGVAADREKWVVTVGQRCTLCHICVQMCQPGALRGTRDEEAGSVNLCFDPEKCDGCAACERWCPEGVIRVDKVQDSELPEKGVLARSALLACPACGRYHVPESMVAGIMARMGPGQEALAQRLLLCYDCKGMDIPLRRRGAAQNIVPTVSRDVPLSHGRSR